MIVSESLWSLWSLQCWKASKKKREEEQKGEVATAAKNPYLRRETRPTNLWNTGSKLLAVKAELDNKAESSTSATAAATSTTASNTANALTGNIVMTSDVMENTEEERDINVDIRELLASQQERQYRICGVAIDEVRRGTLLARNAHEILS